MPRLLCVRFRTLGRPLVIQCLPEFLAEPIFIRFSKIWNVHTFPNLTKLDELSRHLSFTRVRNHSVAKFAFHDVQHRLMLAPCTRRPWPTFGCWLDKPMLVKHFPGWIRERLHSLEQIENSCQTPTLTWNSTIPPCWVFNISPLPPYTSFIAWPRSKFALGTLMLLLVSHLHFWVTSLFHTDAMVFYYSSETHRTRLRLRLKDSKFGHKDDDAERLQHWGRLCDKYPHMRGAFKPDLSGYLLFQHPSHFRHLTKNKPTGKSYI